MFVLELVAGYRCTADWIVLERNITPVNAAETLMGGRHSPHAAPFRLLAPWFLGMDGRNWCLSFSLRGSLSYPGATANNGAFADQGLTPTGERTNANEKQTAFDHVPQSNCASIRKAIQR